MGKEAGVRGLIMNKRMIPIGIPTLHCYNRLTRLIQSLDEQTHDCIEISFLIIDNGGNLQASPFMKDLAQARMPIDLVVPSKNLGVSASFNAIIRHFGHCIITGDDVTFTLEDISLLLQEAEASPDSVFVGEQEGGWTLFWMNRPDVWLSMGGFDEGFYPAYYEDNDADRRLALAELSRSKVALPGWSHANSSTLYDGTPEYQAQHWQNFHRNGMYYQRKWGGAPGQERFLTPFNGEAQ
jgi:GT2 family glycosyltransferase